MGMHKNLYFRRPQSQLAIDFICYCSELDMKNVLLGENGHILLSFKSNWFQLDHDYIPSKNDYSAPEVYNSFGEPLWKIHPSADYFSLGAILFELFTGQVSFTSWYLLFAVSDS
jgi:hypothetical protein